MKSAGHSNECQQTDDVDKCASSFWGVAQKGQVSSAPMGANLQATGADAATLSVETQHHVFPRFSRASWSPSNAQPTKRIPSGPKHEIGVQSGREMARGKVLAKAGEVNMDCD